MWFDDFEAAQPQNLFNAIGDDPRLDYGPQRFEPAERWPLASDFYPFALRPDIDSGVMHFRPNEHAAFGLGRWQPDIDDTFDSVLKSSTATEPSDDTIVVTGTRNSFGTLSWTQTGGAGGTGDDLGGDTIEPPPLDEGGDAPPDNTVITITIHINRPLTASEQQALQDLQNSIAAVDAAIRALANNATLVLNGVTVSGAQLKEIWAKTDFQIYDYISFRNGSYRGEADMVNGTDPTISFNISGTADGHNGLDRFNNFTGGVNYLVGHELGHLTQWFTPNFNNEVMANDFARALLNGAGLPYLSNPQGGGYTDGAPMQFSVSAG
jgi:hypothetical protein